MRFCNTRARKLSSGAVLLWIYIPAAGFTPYHDVSDPCGTFTYIGDGENAADGYRVNSGASRALVPLALEISIIDGKALPVIEEAG